MVIHRAGCFPFFGVSEKTVLSRGRRSDGPPSSRCVQKDIQEGKQSALGNSGCNQLIPKMAMPQLWGPRQDLLLQGDLGLTNKARPLLQWAQPPRSFISFPREKLVPFNVSASVVYSFHQRVPMHLVFPSTTQCSIWTVSGFLSRTFSSHPWACEECFCVHMSWRLSGE